MFEIFYNRSRKYLQVLSDIITKSMTFRGAYRLTLVVGILRTSNLTSSHVISLRQPPPSLNFPSEQESILIRIVNLCWFIGFSSFSSPLVLLLPLLPLLPLLLQPMRLKFNGVVKSRNGAAGGQEAVGEGWHVFGKFWMYDLWRVKNCDAADSVQIILILWLQN